MPVVIPIVGAVAAIGGAVAAGGTTLAIIGAVGAVVGAVGAITGVKELAIAGTVIGAIGGIGAIAESAGLLGEVGSFLGLGGSESGNVASMATGATEVAREVGDNASWATDVVNASTATPVEGLTVGSGLHELQQFNAASGLAGEGAAGAGAQAAVDPIRHFSGEAPDPHNYFPDMSGYSPEQLEQMARNGAPISQGDSVPPLQTVEAPRADLVKPPQGSSATPSPGDPATPGGVSATTPGQVSGNAPGASQVNGKVDLATPYNSSIDPATGQTTLTAKANGTVLASPVTGTVDGGASTWTKILDTLGKPGIGTLASGLIQAGSAFVSGATNSLTPAQVAAYNAQADANLAQANLARQQQQLLQSQMANASAVPTATRRPGGLINSTAPEGAPQTPAAPQVAGLPQQQNTAYGLINSAYMRPQQVTGAPA